MWRGSTDYWKPSPPPKKNPSLLHTISVPVGHAYCSFGTYSRHMFIVLWYFTVPVVHVFIVSLMICSFNKKRHVRIKDHNITTYLLVHCGLHYLYVRVLHQW